MSLRPSTFSPYYANKRKTYSSEDERDRHQEPTLYDNSERSYKDFQRYQADERRGQRQDRDNNRRQRHDNRNQERFYDSQPKSNQDQL